MVRPSSGRPRTTSAAVQRDGWGSTRALGPRVGRAVGGVGSVGRAGGVLWCRSCNQPGGSADGAIAILPAWSCENAFVLLTLLAPA